MPELENAELIDGVVYMPSPLSLRHGLFDGRFSLLLHTYALKTPGCQSTGESTWLMTEKSAPQPDLSLYILPEYGGRLQVIGGLASGAPELVVEIVKSSRSYDLGPKLALYQRAQVQEYVAALIEEERIEWRILQDGIYRLMAVDENGVFRSRAFPGLWVDGAAFWRMDGNRLIQALEQGLQSAEHVRFVDTLARKTSSLT